MEQLVPYDNALQVWFHLTILMESLVEQISG